jgi:predicted transcriptional regulator
MQPVKATAYMNFRDAVDRLGERVAHEQVADALGVSVASVRQYRLSPKAKAHRTPPNGWQKALARLARERSRELRALAEALERGTT